MSPTPHLFPTLLLGIGLTLTGCATDSTGPDCDKGQCDERGDDVITQDQGWSDGMRELYYYTSQGSRFLSYDWFVALEQAGSVDRFASAQNMRSYGFIVDGPSGLNPDGLPIGFARDEDPEKGDAIGFTCSACHTGQVEFEGKTVRIDGGSTLNDLESFQLGLLASLEDTKADYEKFGRFSSAILGDRSSDSAALAELEAALDERIEWWQGRVKRGAGPMKAGPGRTDAFAVIGNEVFCEFLDIPENCRPSDAPANYPFMWGAPQMDWVQYMPIAHSPLGRNVGETLGVFAEMEMVVPGDISKGIKSSSDLDALVALEDWLIQLKAPRWDERVFPVIDTVLASTGRDLYEQNCIGCHSHPDQPRMTEPNAFGKSFVMTSWDTPLQEIGTDPTQALAFATRFAKPGVFPLEAFPAQVQKDGEVLGAVLLGAIGGVVIDTYFAMNGITDDAQKLDYAGFRESLSPTAEMISTYKARSLEGIAFTAPYLHNGSIATIRDLLTTPDQRPTTFSVGSLQFDPENLGYSTKAGPGTHLYDTTIPGNGNGGHLWGTDLASDEKDALLEFLKTL